jgi:hypothetical protein
MVVQLMNYPPDQPERNGSAECCLMDFTAVTSHSEVRPANGSRNAYSVAAFVGTSNEAKRSLSLNAAQ